MSLLSLCSRFCHSYISVHFPIFALHFAHVTQFTPSLCPTNHPVLIHLFLVSCTFFGIMSLFWSLFPVFGLMPLFPGKSRVTSNAAAWELADRIRSTLGKLHPAFSKYADALQRYIDIWNKQHAFHPHMLPVSSRCSYGPPADSKHSCAAFTIQHQEAIMLPLWLR